MEPKKNPEYDVHNKRDLFFNLSLAISLLLVISAFRIAVPYTERKVLNDPVDLDEIMPAIPITEHKKSEPKPVNPPRKPIVNARNIRVAEPESLASENPGIDQEPADEGAIDFSGVEIPIEVFDDTTTWINVERRPEPVGGYSTFYKTLRDNINYPQKARRYGTEGKVYVQFTIDKSGDVTDTKVIRGIGNGCDEEAARVIKLTKWNAGKQRGKPVKVRMVLPVVFEFHR